MAKECDGCTVCCTVLRIPSLNKDADIPCTHCDRGCRIYPKRPGECVRFQCLWSETPVLDPELRPDRCGIMFELYADERIVVAITTVAGAWQRARPLRLISQMTTDGYAVWVIEGKDRHLFLPEGDDKDSVLQRTKLAWRRQNGRT